MAISYPEILALITLMLWPVVPLFWIPVHCAPHIFRRIGLFTYLLPLFTMPHIVFIIYRYKDILLHPAVELPIGLNIGGGILLIVGGLLQTWTLVLLTLPVIMGMPEVSSKVKGRLVTAGPFSVVRHPTYLSHTLMLLGVFLLTEVVSVGAITLIDAVVVNLVIIPLEERELAARFGSEYDEYRRMVRHRFLPCVV